MSRPVLRPLLVGVSLTAALGVLLLAPSTGSAAVRGRELALRFNSGVLTDNSGSANLEVRTLTAGGGTMQPSSRTAGGDDAVRLPAFDATQPQYAAFRVVDGSGGDDLTPLRAPFRFGADFTLDAQSEGSSTDDGNNVVQRGRFDDGMQYKIQVDKDRPSCRIQGSAGAVMVTSRRVVQPGDWYRVSCARDRRRVTMVVTHLADGVSRTYRAKGAIGSLKPTSRSIALSVGAKLDENGDFARSADQLNGRVDNVFVNISS